jgi:hypothetical protein
LETKDLRGTNMERRIKQVMQQGDQAAHLYKLKESTLKLNFHQQSFSQGQIDYVKETNRAFLHTFGYTNPASDTQYYQYKTQTESDLKRFNSYKQVNRDSLEQVCSLDWLSNEKRPGYQVNKQDVFPLFDPTLMLKIQEPNLLKAKADLLN